MEKRQLNAVIDRLEKYFPEARCELRYKTPFELLVAVILSAQCTDKRVNAVTKELFEKYRTPEDFAAISDGELERLLYPVGFYKNKARAVKSAAELLLKKYGGEVPDGFDELIKIPGVGRKTANVILSEAFHKDAFAVDTHVLRVSKRFGIADGESPYKTELAVGELLDGNRLGKAHILLVLFGRYVCVARKPKCGECPVSDLCPSYMNGAAKERAGTANGS
ncbi:MAG: endonuclease III [Clostridiales bacterium]|jgi:endonuclease-3|nr:endonuclease III [Clostridiales bacterium]